MIAAALLAAASSTAQAAPQTGDHVLGSCSASARPGHTRLGKRRAAGEGHRQLGGSTKVATADKNGDLARRPAADAARRAACPDREQRQWAGRRERCADRRRLALFRTVEHGISGPARAKRRGRGAGWCGRAVAAHESAATIGRAAAANLRKSAELAGCNAGTRSAIFLRPVTSWFASFGRRKRCRSVRSTTRGAGHPFAPG